MKKILQFFFLMLLTIPAHSQYQYSMYHYSPTALLKQLGVKTCTIYKSSTDTLHLESMPQMRYSYDRNGNETENMKYSVEDTTAIATRYNAQGKISSQTWFVINHPEFTMIDSFIYDKDNRLIKMTEALGRKQSSYNEYKYKDTLLVCENFYLDNNWLRTTFNKYDKKGNLIEDSVKISAGISSHSYYSYDQMGYLIGFSEFRNNAMTQDSFVVDKQGRPLELYFNTRAVGEHQLIFSSYNNLGLKTSETYYTKSTSIFLADGPFTITVYRYTYW